MEYLYCVELRYTSDHHEIHQVTSVVELGEDGSMVSTVKKSNGDTVVHVGTIAEDGALEVVNTLTKAIFIVSLALSPTCFHHTALILITNQEDGTEVVSKNRHVKVEEE